MKSIFQMLSAVVLALVAVIFYIVYLFLMVVFLPFQSVQKSLSNAMDDWKPKAIKEAE